MSKGDQDHDWKNHRECCPELVGAHRLWTNMGNLYETELGPLNLSDSDVA